ncbi:unnamed protein product, partial [Rotaria magnacalcarata]
MSLLLYVVWKWIFTRKRQV